MSCITEVYLNNEKDSVRWCLTKNGQFTTASLYQHCSFWRVVDIRMEEMWNTKLPLKVKNFPWLLYHERIQAAEANGKVMRSANCAKMMNQLTT
jgi:hypothetical protein